MDQERAPELFIGKQECTIDEKRRFSVPPKFRVHLEEQTTPSGTIRHVVLIPWYGGSVAAFPVRRWKEIEHRILAMDYTTQDFLEAKRRCLPLMEYTHTDPEGRVMLTQDMQVWLRLKERAKGKVMVVGLGQHLEVWNADEWPDVETTGRNGATRPAQDVEYDKQLDLLMQAARDAQVAQAAATAKPVEDEA